MVVAPMRMSSRLGFWSVPIWYCSTIRIENPSDFDRTVVLSAPAPGFIKSAITNAKASAGCRRGTQNGNHRVVSRRGRHRLQCPTRDNRRRNRQRRHRPRRIRGGRGHDKLLQPPIVRIGQRVNGIDARNGEHVTLVEGRRAAGPAIRRDGAAGLARAVDQGGRGGKGARGVRRAHRVLIPAVHTQLLPPKLPLGVVFRDDRTGVKQRAGGIG